MADLGQARCGAGSARGPWVRGPWTWVGGNVRKPLLMFVGYFPSIANDSKSHKSLARSTDCEVYKLEPKWNACDHALILAMFT